MSATNNINPIRDVWVSVEVGLEIGQPFFSFLLVWGWYEGVVVMDP
jgi:hypothetical protein